MHRQLMKPEQLVSASLEKGEVGKMLVSDCQFLRQDQFMMYSNICETYIKRTAFNYHRFKGDKGKRKCAGTETENVDLM